MKFRALLLLAIWAWLSPAAADPDPAPPYYSLQLASDTEIDHAAVELRRLKDLPGVRIEKRGSYFSVRAGAWHTRQEALDALPAFKSRGYQDATVIRIVNAARWIEPTPMTAALPPARNKPEPAAEAAVETPAPVLTPAPTMAAAPAPPAPRSLEIPPAARDLNSAAKALDWQVRNLVAQTGLARRDGFVYTLDVASLLLYAARRGDQPFFEALRAAATPLVWSRGGDPFTRGFVLWRYRKGVDPEVSGAAEALHLARALWAGAEAFGNRKDRELALTIIEGYRQHVYELGDDWLVRKYYAFGGKVFANLSVIGAYLPDFLAEVERARDTQWSGPSLAERSYGVLERAVSEIGLLYPVIQPEINQTYPGLDLDVYAPNNVLPAADSCDAAEAAVKGRPRLAKQLLEFVRDTDRRDRTGYLYAYFDAATGERIRRQVVSAPTLACLARLATALDNRKVLEWIRPLLLLEIQSLAAVPTVQEAPLFGAGPLLLAADAMGAFK